MNNIPKISAAIIAYNAENTIVNCLNSIKDYCSEIIIALDTKTTDETRQRIIDFARNNNPDNVHRGLEDNGKQIGKVKIYDFEWVNDSFADARNFSLSKATSDWILIIDCDETLHNYEIPDNDFDFYVVPIHNYRNNELETITYSPKLFKNNIGIEYRWKTHEDNRQSLSGKIGTKARMYFEHNEKTIENLTWKTNWLLERALRDYPLEHDNPCLKGQIGTYYQTLENYAESLKWLHRAMFDNVDNPLKAQAAIRIFINYQALDNTDCDNAMSWLYLSIALCPKQLQARYILYQIYKNDNQPELAEIQKQEIIKVGNGSQLPFDMVFENINF